MIFLCFMEEREREDCCAIMRGLLFPSFLAGLPGADTAVDEIRETKNAYQKNSSKVQVFRIEGGKIHDKIKLY